MSTRAYDYILRLENASNFKQGNIIFGVSSNSIAEIVSVNNNNVKVRLANLYSQFITGETILSNSVVMYSVNVFQEYNTVGEDLSIDLPIDNVFSDSVTVYINNSALPREYYYINPSNVVLNANYFLGVDFESNASTDNIIVQVVTGNTNAAYFISSNIALGITTANSNLLSISSSPYIAEKNSTQQTPIVKMYSIYYPGEWYPKNANGNPSKSGAGRPWPYNFPLRYAEFLGETFSDFNYSISLGNTEYKVIALNGGGLDTDDTGTINSTTLEISNFDGVISRLVDNTNIVGYNSSNSTSAIVNGELVSNIDPRTVPSNIFYDSLVAASRGINAPWDVDSTLSHGDNWVSLKEDTRDLLGAVVEIKLTYAKFLDYWPEFSIISNVSGNIITMYSTSPYRVGDNVYSSANNVVGTITKIYGNYIYADIPAAIGAKLYIVNPDADPDSYVEHTFVLNRLEELNDFTAKFELTNLLQYFKMELPKRRFFRTTCPWSYKGAECKYPINGSGTIIGSNPPITSNGFFTFRNEPTLNESEDICAKTYTACALRKNLVNFGGFSNGV